MISNWPFKLQKLYMNLQNSNFIPDFHLNREFVDFVLLLNKMSTFILYCDGLENVSYNIIINV